MAEPVSADSVAAPTTDPLERVERLAHWLDEAIRIPGTQFRIGVDALIGLVPVVGDAAGLAMGSWLVYEAHRLGAPVELKLRMMRNVIIDAFAGLVPVIGDAVDMAYRSNRRNLALLRAHFRPAAETRGAPLWLRAVVLLSAAGGACWLWQHYHS